MTRLGVEFMRMRGAKTPDVMLYEDLHWIDSANESMLQAFCDADEDSRTLRVFTYRPD